MSWRPLAARAVIRVVIALSRGKARWDRFWWRVTPCPRRCAHRGCSRDWFDTWWGSPYCRVHHPEYENPIGTEVVRRLPWRDGESGLDDRAQMGACRDPLLPVVLVAAIVVVQVVIGFV